MAKEEKSYSVRFNGLRKYLEEQDFEDVFTRASKEDKESDEESDKKSDDSKYTLSELAAVLYAFGNDVRILHLYTSGLEFTSYHEKLNDLYSVLFDAYDTCAELAISHGEKIVNPTKVLDICTEWEPIEGDKFTAEDIIRITKEKGDIILGNIANIKEYESFVQSEIDDFSGEIDKIINYVFTQSGK